MIIIKNTTLGYLLLSLCHNKVVGFVVSSNPLLSPRHNGLAAVVARDTNNRFKNPGKSTVLNKSSATVVMMTVSQAGVDARNTAPTGGVVDDDASDMMKCPVLICPAQLGVPGDYRKMIAELHKRGFPAYVADLTRAGWITGLLPSALSMEYITGNLVPAKTLKFYYDAIDRALEELKAKHPGEGIHLIGHSIGGWVSRAWLAEGCSQADREKILSLTTLGTPNNNPPEEKRYGGDWKALDQTRGLLKNINERFPGAHVEGVRYTSVGGTALQGKMPGNIEEMLASVSYEPLCGDGESVGDGIIPIETALLEGSYMVEIPTSRHSGFLPFIGDAIDLGDNFLWYGSSSLIDEWVGTLDEAEQQQRFSGRETDPSKTDKEHTTGN